jgi:hypothetical protein
MYSKLYGRRLYGLHSTHDNFKHECCCAMVVKSSYGRTTGYISKFTTSQIPVRSVDATKVPVQCIPRKNLALSITVEFFDLQFLFR